MPKKKPPGASEPKVVLSPAEAAKVVGDWQQRIKRAQRDAEAKRQTLELLAKHFPECLSKFGGERLDRLFVEHLPNHKPGDLFGKTWPMVLIAVEELRKRTEMVIDQGPDVRFAAWVYGTLKTGKSDADGSSYGHGQMQQMMRFKGKIEDALLQVKSELHRLRIPPTTERTDDVFLNEELPEIIVKQAAATSRADEAPTMEAARSWPLVKVIELLKSVPTPRMRSNGNKREQEKRDSGSVNEDTAANSAGLFIRRLESLAATDDCPRAGMRDVALECERNPQPDKASEAYFAGWWDGDVRWILHSPQPGHQFLNRACDYAQILLARLPDDHEWRRLVDSVPLTNSGPAQWCYLLCRCRGRHEVDGNWQQWKVKDWLTESLNLLHLATAAGSGKRVAAGGTELSGSPATEVPDGPIPRGFRWQGEEAIGLGGIPWKLVNYLWSRRPDGCTYDDLAEHVWGDSQRDGDSVKQKFRSPQNTANRFFADAGLPWKVSAETKPHLRQQPE